MSPRAGTASPVLPVAVMRVVLLAICVVLSIAPPGVDAPALALIGVLAVVAALLTAAGRRGAGAVPAALVESVVTGALIAGSGGSDSPLLPYLLAPALALGLQGGWLPVVGGAAAATVSLIGVRVTGDPDDPLNEFVLATGQWVALSAAVGIFATLVASVGAQPSPTDERFAEVRSLLEQLRALTQGLPGGLDAPSAASALLDRCHELAGAARSAVLVQTAPGQLAPLAVRGTKRVPWRDPLSSPGPLSAAWETRTTQVDVRKRDPEGSDGRRAGSALAVIPLVEGQEPFGLVVLEARDPDAYPPETLRRVQRATDDAALRLRTALLFEEVRTAVTLEERNRLARDMHDGVAQDIAFVGYELDALRAAAAKVDPALADQAGEVRKRLTALISDIRLSITDLRTSVSPDRGLGAALSSYVRAIGSGKQLTVHLSLEEGAFRLPAEAEVLLFQIAQAVAQDARRSREAHNLWVSLSVDPPSARLVIEHDGPMPQNGEPDLGLLPTTLARTGGQVQTSRGESGGPRVEVVLEGDTDGAERPPRRRPRAHPRGTAQGVRADG